MKPKIEHRIVCAAHGVDPTHQAHAYSKPDRKRADHAAAFNTSTPYGTHARSHEPVPAHVGCQPYRVEARLVGPWENPVDVDELAAMLMRDWWGQ